MRLVKKVTAAAMASAMALSLAACGGGNTATTAAPTEAAKETAAASEAATEAAKEAAETAANAAGTADVADKKVGISIYKFDDNFMTLYRQELQRYLTEDLGFKPENVVIQDGKGDQAEQTNQINNFITQKYDVLILNLVQASSAPEITDMCKEAGIPVVYINREPDEAEEQRWVDEKINATYVGCDARQSGTYQGEEILETETKGDINGDGKVSYIMIQGDPENVDAQYRTEFSVKALTDAGVEVEELLKQRGDWDQAKAQQIAQDALNQYGDKIEVIFCNNDAMALGALQAIEAAGRKVNEDIYLVGVDALTEAVQNVIDGKQTGTVFNDHFSVRLPDRRIQGSRLSLTQRNNPGRNVHECCTGALPSESSHLFCNLPLEDIHWSAHVQPSVLRSHHRKYPLLPRILHMYHLA